MLISIKISRNSAFLGSDKPTMLLFPLMNVKMPTIVGFLTFMSRKNFMLNWVLHEKRYIILGPEQRCLRTICSLTSENSCRKSDDTWYFISWCVIYNDMVGCISLAPRTCRIGMLDMYTGRYTFFWAFITYIVLLWSKPIGEVLNKRLKVLKNDFVLSFSGVLLGWRCMGYECECVAARLGWRCMGYECECVAARLESWLIFS